MCQHTSQPDSASLFGACVCLPLSFDGRAAECAATYHLAPLSATIHTVRATHSQLHTLFNSYKMVRSPLLRSHLLTHMRLMVLLLQALFVSSSLSSRSAISSQVTAGPTRNGTGDVMPLAEAITQLSYLEFSQRCGVSIAPPQPSQPPVPISLLDAAVQTTPPCAGLLVIF